MATMVPVYNKSTTFSNIAMSSAVDKGLSFFQDITVTN